MITRTYIRPVGRLTRPPGRINATPDKVVRIGEREEVVFSALEMLQRHNDGSVDRRIMSPSEVRHEIGLGGVVGEHLKVALSNLVLPRAALSGIALDRPRIMGIVNVTPDSFSDGGSFASAREAIAHARRLVDEGAELIDVGGESTRPGSDPVPLDEELRRVLPVIEGLAGKVRARISVDTRKAEVMRRASLAGVNLINDVSALTFDSGSMRVVAESKLPVVLMHALGDPKTMQNEPRYGHVLLDVYDMLAQRVEQCVRAGISRDRIIVDPGIGFGKTLEHNLDLIAGISIYHALGTAVMLGASRKSIIGKLTGAVDPAERVPGSIATALAGAMQGVNILRVHDVAATRQALTVWEAATGGKSPS